VWQASADDGVDDGKARAMIYWTMAVRLGSWVEAELSAVMAMACTAAALVRGGKRREGASD
jgi:hypothetical protein